MMGLRELTPAERVMAFAERGIRLYIVGESLRATCEPEVEPLLAEARPALRKHRSALVRYLQSLTTPQGGQ